MPRWSVVLLAVGLPAFALGACGDGGGVPSTAQPGVVNLPGGAKRVTLTANYVVDLDGQGWDLAAGRITADPIGSDFHVTVAMVVSLAATTEMNGLCKKAPSAGAPAFARVEDVPGDAASCASWGIANLGGTFEHSESLYAGQGFLARDRAGVPAAKLLTVADYVINGDVGVTFDIIGL